MAKTINAIYENGVFKPLEPISLKEHERVTLDINLEEQLRMQLKKLTEKIYKRGDGKVRRQGLTCFKIPGYAQPISVIRHVNTSKEVWNGVLKYHFLFPSSFKILMILLRYYSEISTAMPA